MPTICNVCHVLPTIANIWQLLADIIMSPCHHPSISQCQCATMSSSHPAIYSCCNLVILLLCLFVILSVWQLVSFSAFLLCNYCYHLKNSRQHHPQLQPVERARHQQQQVRLLYEVESHELVQTNINIKSLESNFCRP